jgi:hypothetical protein
VIASCEEISERSLTLEAVNRVVEKEMPDKVLEEVKWFCRRYTTQNFPSADVEAGDLALRGKYQNDMVEKWFYPVARPARTIRAAQPGLRYTNFFTHQAINIRCTTVVRLERAGISRVSRSGSGGSRELRLE